MPDFFTVLALIAVTRVAALERPGGVGRLPALGWNTWNAYHCDLNEDHVISAANQLVSLGLKDAGYQYVNIDDCWSMKSGRDAVTSQIVPDPNTFPSGITALGDQIHSLGLKIGIYSDAGSVTCDGYPASLSFEDIDATTFASWGIDYLKYDNCNVPDDWVNQYRSCVPEDGIGHHRTGPFPNGTCAVTDQTAPAGYDWSQSKDAERFKRMGTALLNQNRTIEYSLCIWGEAQVWDWGNMTGASWRVTDDITADWSRILEITNENQFHLNSIDFWGHNDADLLEVGNGQLTFEENRSHFALWAAMKSPLLISTDLNVLAKELVAVLANPRLLAFNQDDVFGKSAQPFKWDWNFNPASPAQYWSGASKHGVLVLMGNWEDQPAQRNVLWEEVPHLQAAAGASFMVVDIWTGASLGCVEGGLNQTVARHDTLGFLVSNNC